MGMCRALQGRLTEAIEIGERAVAMSGRAPFYLGVLGHYYARSGATEKVREIVEELEGLAGPAIRPATLLRVHPCWVERHRPGVEWQAKAYDDGASPFNYFSPLIENLHADPRHTAELRRMAMRAWAKGTKPHQRDAIRAITPAMAAIVKATSSQRL